MSITIKYVKQINNIFSSQLIDQEFLIKFNSEFYYDFLYQIHYIRNLKNQDQKKQFLILLSNQCNQLLSSMGRKVVSFERILWSRKVSDYAHLIRQILCKNGKSLRNFFQIRSSSLKNLKHNQKNQGQFLNGFIQFYDVILQGNLHKVERNPKTVLTGIRKLFRNQKTKKKDKRDRRKQKDLLKHRKMLYRTNRIIRDILEHSLELKKMYDNDVVFLDNIIKILGERRWMGPNLYKILVTEKWKGYQIDTLIDLMQQAYQLDPKYNEAKASALIMRTIANLKTSSQFLKKNPNIGSVRLIATVQNMSFNFFSNNNMDNNFFLINGEDKQNIGYRNLEKKHSLSSQLSVDFD